MLLLRTFGGLSLSTEDGRPLTGAHAQRSRLAVLAVLAAAGEQGVSRDRILGLLWPECDAAQARGSLRQSLYAIRQGLGDVILGTTELRLDRERITSDLHQFDDALAAGALKAAVALYRGSFLEGIHLRRAPEFEHWLDQQRHRLAQQHQRALERLAVDASESGDAAAAVRWWGELAVADPLNGRVTLALVNALVNAGDPASAIRIGDAHAVRVREELGVEVPPDLRIRIDGLRFDLREQTTHGTSSAADAGTSATTSHEEPHLPEAADAHPGLTDPQADGSPRALSGEPASALAGHALFTWRRVVLVGAAAFGLLAVIMVGWLGTRALGVGPAATLFARGALEERDRILLADFDSPPHDSLVAATVTEALRIDLEQGSVVRFLEPREVEAALERMGREPGTRLDAETSEELAIREGIPAVLVGEVHRAGDSFVLAARLIATGGAGTLASFRESAGNTGEIIAAVDALSAKVRARIGESLRSVRASEPLARVTTTSLDALERYSRAVRLMAMEPESRQAITLLVEAIALDSTFAMAHLRLGMLYLSTGEFWHDRQRDAVAAAYRHRERLSVRERYRAEIEYHKVVTGDESARSLAIERHAAEHPDDPEALQLLAFERMRQGDYGRMEEIGRHLLAIDSMRAPSAQVLLQALGMAERYDEMEASMVAYLRRFPADSLFILDLRSSIAAARQHWSEAGRLWQRLRDSGRGTHWVTEGSWQSAELALIEGRLDDNLELGLEAIRTSGFPDIWVRFQEANMPLRQRAVSGLPVADQLASVRSAHRAGWLDSIPVMPPLQVNHARFLAAGREPGLATQVLQDWESRASSDERRLSRENVLVARIEIAIAQDRLDEALQHARELRATYAGRCPPCGLHFLGRIHDAAGRADSATIYYERFLQVGYMHRIVDEVIHRAVVMERLGSLYEAQGRLEDARAAYREFISTWEGADPELQPRVEDARRRLASLVAGRG